MTGPTGKALKAELRDRSRLLVVNIDYSNASLVQFLAREVADVIFIDCEQGDTSIQSIPDLVRAAHVEDTPVLVRLPDAEAATIERYMFRGVDGIVVPRVETPEAARGVVEAINYCFGQAAAEKSIVIQIESENAAQALDEFLAIDGIDAFFVGPVDLARSMGFAGDYSKPDVARVITQTIRAIRASGRSVGMLTSCDTIGPLEGAGVNFLYLHTNDFLTHGTLPFETRRSG